MQSIRAQANKKKLTFWCQCQRVLNGGGEIVVVGLWAKQLDLSAAGPPEQEWVGHTRPKELEASHAACNMFC
jgi:kynureninase